MNRTFVQACEAALSILLTVGPFAAVSIAVCSCCCCCCSLIRSCRKSSARGAVRGSRGGDVGLDVISYHVLCLWLSLSVSVSLSFTVILLRGGGGSRKCTLIRMSVQKVGHHSPDQASQSFCEEAETTDCTSIGFLSLFLSLDLLFSLFLPHHFR